MPDQNAHRPLQVTHTIGSATLEDGGPTRAVLRIVAESRARGIDARLLAGASSAGSPGEVTWRPVDMDGALVWFCRRSRPRSFQNSWQMLSRLLRNRHQIDVVHIHGVYLAHTIFAWLLYRIWQVPYVVHPHGTLEPYIQAQGRRHKRCFNWIIGDRILNDAAVIIAASAAEQANVLAQYPNSRTRRVPFGVEPTDTTTAEPALPPAWLEAPVEKRVLYLARLAAKKRPDVLLHAWSQLADQDARLLVAGPDAKWTSSDLAALAQELGCARIDFLGALDHADAMATMQRAGIYVLPSENESFGLSVVESMSAGCAVITTEQTASHTLVDAAEAGITLKRAEPNALTAALQELLADPSRTAAHGRAARQHVASALTWKGTCGALEDLYRDVAAGRVHSVPTEIEVRHV